jgi:hypothetical protein
VRLRQPRHPERVAIVAIGVLVVANLAWFGYRSQDTSTGSRDRPDAVTEVYPPEDAVIRPQDTVGFDLRDDLQGVLSIDAQRIPEDQYTGDFEVGQVFWRPGPGQEFQELPEGTHEATAEFWDTTKTEEEARDNNEVYSYTWRFRVGF